MGVSLVTGCAGFIGSNLVDVLLKNNEKVIGVDNLSTGHQNFLDNAIKNKNFIFYNLDLLEINKYNEFFANVDIVYHLAANADVRYGSSRPRVDLEQNTIVTHNVLEVMRINEIKQIVFSSTGSVYGDCKHIPTPENVAFPIQTSLYGASKLACEGLIQAYAEAFSIKAWIFRFVSILGERYTHGHVYDFYHKLKLDPTQLHVLGDGTQKKSYLYVDDCIDAILFALNNTNSRINIFNLGVNDYCDVKSSVEWICKELNLTPKIIYSGGKQGWIGDNPFIYLDVDKISKIGWKPKLSIKQSILKTVSFLRSNEWVFNER